jgi:hypothetical protein
MRRALAAFLAGALVMSSCSGDKQSPTQETTTTVETSVPLEDHSITFVPEEDSFSFENFGGGEPPADLTVNMARRMYGDDQVCQDVVDNQCTPYPVILQLISQANRSMRGGLCEGLAVLSLRLEGDATALTTFQQVQQAVELVKEDPALLSEIAYWYVTQFSPEVQERATMYRSMSPTDLAEILMDDFASAEAGNPHTGYTIGIYSDEGGHAVTPYRAEETANGGYRIYIYDSNWPSTERWIDIGPDGTWVYALAATNPSEEASAWSGSVGTMELTPMGSRQGPFTCSFCPQSNSAKSGTMLTVAATGEKQMSIQIETEEGQRLGYYDNTFINEIPGATYRYLISGPSTADPVLVFLPPEVEAFSADVGQIETPADTSDDEEPQEEVEKEQFSLLLLNEEKSVQVEAIIQDEPVAEPIPGAPVEETSILDITEESIEVGELEEATVAIAVETVEIEIQLDEGQQIEVEFVPAEVVEEAETIDIGITDETGEIVAEVEIDLEERPVDEAPTVVEIYFDEESGEIVQEEEEIEAWVASDAEYFQAVAEDRVEEVLGEAWAEEYEEEKVWEDEDAVSLLEETLAEIEEDYWEDERWEEVSYDEEYFEEQEEKQEKWKDDTSNPLVLEAPVLIEQAPATRTSVVRSWTTVDLKTLSEATDRTEVYQDEAGTLTEVWMDTHWEVRETTSEWTETLHETGTLNTYSDNGELVEETVWETAVWEEDSEESSVVTDSWVTSDLVATGRDCLYRQNREEPFTPSRQVFVRLPLQGDPWDNDTEEKPSGCATPGEATTVAREDAATSSSETTTTHERNTTDGWWYEEDTTVTTTVTTYTDVTTVIWSDGYTAITEGDPYDVTTTVTTSSDWLNDCVVADSVSTAWTGFGDFCIVDVESGTFNQDVVTFDVTETTTIEITASTDLTCDGWPGTTANGEDAYGDPFIYLYDGSDDSLLESDDDDGCTCGNNCPDSGNCWDSFISRTLSPGTYYVEAKVYSGSTSGWYKLMIDTV